MNDMPPIRYGNWLQTYSGRQFWPLDPRVEEVNYRDIAHALSNLCRYGGHCLHFYSVAEHSVLIARWLMKNGYAPEVCLAGLFHDAPEAYLVDVPRPIKGELHGYKAIEERLWLVIAEWLGIPAKLPAIVHTADNRILLDEKLQNMAIGLDWSITGFPLGVNVENWEPMRAKLEFLACYFELKGII